MRTPARSPLLHCPVLVAGLLFFSSSLIPCAVGFCATIYIYQRSSQPTQSVESCLLPGNDEINQAARLPEGVGRIRTASLPLTRQVRRCSQGRCISSRIRGRSQGQEAGEVTVMVFSSQEKGFGRLNDSTKHQEPSPPIRSLILGLIATCALDTNYPILFTRQL